MIPTCASSSLALDIYIVVVQGQVGKEFLDNRQDEREIKFITVGDTIRTAGQLKGRTDVEQGSLIHFYAQGTRSGIGVFWFIY